MVAIYGRRSNIIKTCCLHLNLIFVVITFDRTTISEDRHQIVLSHANCVAITIVCCLIEAQKLSSGLTTNVSLHVHIVWVPRRVDTISLMQCFLLSCLSRRLDEHGPIYVLLCPFFLMSLTHTSESTVVIENLSGVAFRGTICFTLRQ